MATFVAARLAAAKRAATAVSEVRAELFFFSMFFFSNQTAIFVLLFDVPDVPK